MTTTPIGQRLRGWAARLLRPDGPPPRPSRRNLLFDALLALALAIAVVQFAADTDQQDIMFIEGVDQPVPPIPPQEVQISTFLVLVAVAASAALVLRRRYPLAVLWATLGATLLTGADEPRLTFYACVVAAYSAAAYSPYRVPTFTTIGLTVLSVSVFSDSPLPVVPTQYVPIMILAPIAMAADGLRRWKLRAGERERRMTELESAQAEAVRRAAEAERARIARELHDVVTHNVSVMVIQSGAARKVMTSDPGQASEALLAVEAGGREAMAELRQVVGLLRADEEDDEDEVELRPQPGTDQISSLVDRVRDAGLDVSLDVIGEPRELPPSVELAAYRIVQEALTNTMKHASGASAQVTVEYRDDALRVEVVDSGGAAAEPGTERSGRGLVGLRERIAVHGGTLHAARRLTGGYQVEAVIPLEVP